MSRPAKVNLIVLIVILTCIAVFAWMFNILRGVRVDPVFLPAPASFEIPDPKIKELEDTILMQGKVIEKQDEAITKWEAYSDNFSPKFQELCSTVTSLRNEAELKDKRIGELELQEIRVKLPKTWQLGDTIEPMPIYSMKPKLDCDDSTIFMYLWLTNAGYEAKIMWGNLEKTGEWEGNHYWVIAVSDNGTEYPYDFGYYLPDEQHFEGREVSYKSLLYWAGVDQR